MSHFQNQKLWINWSEVGYTCWRHVRSLDISLGIRMCPLLWSSSHEGRWGLYKMIHTCLVQDEVRDVAQVTSSGRLVATSLPNFILYVNLDIQIPPDFFELVLWDWSSADSRPATGLEDVTLIYRGVHAILSDQCLNVPRARAFFSVLDSTCCRHQRFQLMCFGSIINGNDVVDEERWWCPISIESPWLTLVISSLQLLRISD